MIDPKETAKGGFGAASARYKEQLAKDEAAKVAATAAASRTAAPLTTAPPTPAPIVVADRAAPTSGAKIAPAEKTHTPPPHTALGAPTKR